MGAWAWVRWYRTVHHHRTTSGAPSYILRYESTSTKYEPSQLHPSCIPARKAEGPQSQLECRDGPVGRGHLRPAFLPSVYAATGGSRAFTGDGWIAVEPWGGIYGNVPHLPVCPHTQQPPVHRHNIIVNRGSHVSTANHVEPWEPMGEVNHQTVYAQLISTELIRIWPARLPGSSPRASNSIRDGVLGQHLYSAAVLTSRPLRRIPRGSGVEAPGESTDRTQGSWQANVHLDFAP